MKRLAILGSTGSIGVTTLGIVERFPDRFGVVSLAAGRNVDRLAEQVRRFRPKLVAVGDAAAAEELRGALGDRRCEILHGTAGMIAVATIGEADMVISGLVGALGLLPTLEAVRAGKDVALANKEVLVVAGELVTRAAAERATRLYPLDSEHNAIFQALHGHRREDVRRIVLTASGGPFLQRPAAELAGVSREEALRHPTWKMGNKITIDSATLMNKGLEVIEARWLFGFPPAQVGVVVHPQSIVHSMVEYVDGSVIAQMGIADMTIPISYILGYPERLPLAHLPALDLPSVRELTFFEPDLGKFPCLALAYRALETGGSMPAVLNAANEVAVARFLEGGMRFTDIPATLERVMSAHRGGPAPDLDDCLDADRWARAEAGRILAELAG
ncbi:MAG: 1-deoxy-D-xylulose-5-phosphate reductoisomerase [Candidatus Binatia bacterium]